MKEIQLKSGDRIPYSSNIPTGLNKKLLENLGFDLENMVKIGKWYYLSVPDSTKIRCVQIMPENIVPPYDVDYKVYYGDLVCVSIQERFKLEEGVETLNSALVTESNIINLAIALNQNTAMYEIELTRGSKVYYGSAIPTGYQAELLTELGFDLKRMEEKGENYFLTLPDTPGIRCVRLMPNFENETIILFIVKYKMYYGDVEFFTQTRVFDSKGNFEANKSCGYSSTFSFIDAKEVRAQSTKDKTAGTLKKREVPGHVENKQSHAGEQLMQIPFGKKIPDFQNAESLKKLGFDLSNMVKEGEYYFLTLPDTSRISCNRVNPDFDKVTYSIYYNKIEVIHISQKTAFWDPYVIVSINHDKIEEALAKNSEITEDMLQKELETSQVLKLTEYQLRLQDRLKQLEFIVLGPGASAGYGRGVGNNLALLRELKEENPVEHNSLISSTFVNRKLFNMFPDWTDRGNLQAQYEAMDRGPLMGMMTSSEDGIMNPNSCRLM